MRNAKQHIIALFIGLGLLTGCASSPHAPAIDAGFRNLQARQYPEALRAADSYLRDHPTGTAAAEALYLRGRALEEQPANPAQSRANLLAARQAYLQSLTKSPSPKLEAYLHASIGNVAYLLEDYPTAITELNRGLEGLDLPELRATALYRMGVSQQRLGQFTDADNTFRAIQQNYPSTSLASAARDHQGIRAFYVQLGAFSTRAAINQAIAQIRRSGINPLEAVNARGLHVLRVGPFATYTQARAQKSRFSAQFPDAQIIP